jgi:hypothetical protein
MREQSAPEKDQAAFITPPIIPRIDLAPDAMYAEIAKSGEWVIKE